MSSRKIQSPGVEINEIDRSQYGKVDYSLPNSPNTLITGFASKGEDYSLQWINSKSTLDNTYGQPTTEFEQYFYDGISEILKRGGTCIAAKLPYYNNASNKLNYSEFIIENGSNTYISKILSDTDNYITSYLDICQKNYQNYKASDLSEFDDYLTHNKTPEKNHIRIYDTTRAKYNSLTKNAGQLISSEINDFSNDFLGIVPIIVTPANALFFQNMLSINDNADLNDILMFNQISNFTSLSNKNVVVSVDITTISSSLLIPLQSTYPVDSTDYSIFQCTNVESLSKKASQIFPIIGYDSTGHLDPVNLKKIGIAVFKAFSDVDNNGKINFQLVESFVGSLDKNARDPITKSNIFIDDVVNSSSQYIAMFSNIDQQMFENASTLTMSQQYAMSLGFYNVDCKKIIDYNYSITDALTKILDTAENKYTLPIDLVVDAGTSNIAQIAILANNRHIDTDERPLIADYDEFKLNSINDTLGWRAILKKFDDFAKYTRKDIMFIADGLRTFCLDGNVKIVRKTAPQNTITNSILPKLKYMSNTFESSYAAGYCNWFYQQSSSSTDYIWTPPSIKALGVYIYCSTYFQPWSAPAGLTRGVLTDVVDIAFIPNEDEAGKIYNAQWNYAMSYPLDGIVIEGHKTFQAQKTALDRVNVRRLLLHLEKQTFRVARRFVYEENTEYTRQRFVDTLRPIFEDAVKRGGLREYAIKCDDEINTNTVIENNELRCHIAVKPVKVVDFIVLDFIASRQNADVTEEVVSTF